MWSVALHLCQSMWPRWLLPTPDACSTQWLFGSERHHFKAAVRAVLMKAYGFMLCDASYYFFAHRSQITCTLCMQLLGASLTHSKAAASAMIALVAAGTAIAVAAVTTSAVAATAVEAAAAAAAAAAALLTALLALLTVALTSAAVL
jgi:hypothetical protein